MLRQNFEEYCENGKMDTSLSTGWFDLIRRIQDFNTEVVPLVQQYENKEKERERE